MVLFIFQWGEPISKKKKKKLLAKKNKKHQLLFQMIRERKAISEHHRKLNAGLTGPKKNEKKNTAALSDKTSSIRNRLTGRKRESKERWNRFAGTGGAGGRGL